MTKVNDNSSSTPNSFEIMTPTGKSIPLASPRPTPSKPSFATSEVRGKEDIGYVGPQFTHQQRDTCSSKDKQQFIKDASEGANLKLSKLDYDKINDQTTDDLLLKTNVNVDRFIETFETHGNRYDMLYIFKNFPLLENAIDSGGDASHFHNGNTIDLLDNWDQIGEKKTMTLGMIADTIVWLKRFTTTDVVP